MNLGTLIGLLLGTALIGTAAFLGAAASNQPISQLGDVNSLLIVVGGSIAATAIAFKMKAVLRLFGLLKMIFKDDGFTLGDVVDDLCDLASAQRSGRKEFEAALQGSPQTPYIFDDRPRWEDAGDTLYEWYKTSKKDRVKAGNAGREYCLLPETSLSAKNMGKAFIESIDTTLEEFQPIKQFQLYEV